MQGAAAVIFDDPMHGTDAGAAQRASRLNLAEEGRPVVVISSRLPERPGAAGRLPAGRGGRDLPGFGAADTIEDRVTHVAITRS